MATGEITHHRAGEPAELTCYTARMRALLVLLVAPLISATPAEVAPPPGATPGLRLYANGTQNYACTVPRDGGAATWTLTGPEALLFDSPDGGIVGRHIAGPTWELTRDGSRFVGDAKAARSAPAPTGADDVNWLWVRRKASRSSPGQLGKFTAVQRVDTHGGVAPAGGCDAGAAVEVPYQATYIFY